MQSVRLVQLAHPDFRAILDSRDRLEILDNQVSLDSRDPPAPLDWSVSLVPLERQVARDLKAL